MLEQRIHNRKIGSLRTLIGAGIALAGLTACLETTGLGKVDTSVVYQGLSLEYSDDRSGFEATAQFTVGGALGTSLALDSGSYVNVDGVALSTESFFGTRYKRSWAASAAAGAHTFEWRDKDGKIYTNTASYKPLNVTQMPVTFSLQSGGSVTISGISASDGGDIRLEVSQSSGSGYSMTSWTGQWTGTNTVTFKPWNGSGHLGAGSAQVRVIWSKSTALSQATAQGGLMTVRHSSRSTWVTLTN